MDDLNNIDKSKLPPNKKTKKVEKVVTGKVVQQKKTFTEKFVSTFIGDEPSNVLGYILYDVLIPTAKDTIVDIVKGGIEMLVKGSRSNYNSSRNDNRSSYFNYNGVSSGTRNRPQQPTYRYNGRSRDNFDNILLASREDAEAVLQQLSDFIYDYGQATVADLYDLVGITGNFTDNKYGWFNLNGAKPRMVRGGYKLDLPRTVDL